MRAELAALALASALAEGGLGAAAPRPPAPDDAAVSRDAMVAGVVGPSSTGAVTGVVRAVGLGKATWYGVGGFARTDVAGVGDRGNAVGLFGIGIVGSDHAAAWGINTITSDEPRNGAVRGRTARTIVGYEADLANYSPGTTVQGVAVLGSSLVQPVSAVGVTVGPLSRSGGVARWTLGFGVVDGALTAGGAAFSVGALEAKGASVPSQMLAFSWRDATGARQADLLRVGGDGALSLSGTAGPRAVALDVDGALRARGRFTAADDAYFEARVHLTHLPVYLSEGAAAAAGLACGQVFRIGSALNVRVTDC